VAKQRKAALIGIARSLYVRGLSVKEISAHLDVSSSTIRRWRASDAEDGRDWDAIRKEGGPTTPHEAIQLLESRIAQVAADAALDPATVADSVWKLERAVASLRERYGDVSRRMEALDGFVQFCIEAQCPQGEWEVVRRWCYRYLDALEAEGGRQ